MLALLRGSDTCPGSVVLRHPAPLGWTFRRLPGSRSPEPAGRPDVVTIEVCMGAGFLSGRSPGSWASMRTPFATRSSASRRERDGRTAKPFAAEPWLEAIAQWMREAQAGGGVNLQALTSGSRPSTATRKLQGDPALRAGALPEAAAAAAPARGERPACSPG